MPLEGFVGERGLAVAIEEEDAFLHRVEDQVLYPATVSARKLLPAHRVCGPLHLRLEGANTVRRRRTITRPAPTKNPPATRSATTIGSIGAV